MVEADFRHRHDVAVTGRHDRTGNRRVFVQRQVSPRFFVVRTVQRHQLPSAGFAEHDRVIEHSRRADPTNRRRMDFARVRVGR